MALLYWDVNASRKYQLQGIQKNIKPIITKKLKLDFESEQLLDRYGIGRVMDHTNFDIKFVTTSMLFKIVAKYTDTTVNVGIEAHGENLDQDLLVTMFTSPRPAGYSSSNDLKQINWD